MNKANNEVRHIFKEFVSVKPEAFPNDFGIVLHPVFEFCKTYNRKTSVFDDTIEDFNTIIEDFIAMTSRMDSVELLIDTIRKPWRLDFVYKIQDHITNKLYSEVLIFAFTTTEFPNWQFYNQGRLDDLLGMFIDASIPHLMTADELSSFEKLPETITVYRGIDERNIISDINCDIYDIYPALSWTLDKKQAQWFADRFNGNGNVLKATIKKQYCFAFIEREKEIILNYDFLCNIEKI